jgi:hypothetical protein
VRPVSQLCFNQLFSKNKVSTKCLVISHLSGFATISLPLLPFFCVFFISSILILQMANTRNHVTGNNIENSGDNNNQYANPPPPQPPPLSRDRLGDFQRTKLPTFSHVAEPMDADDWCNNPYFRNPNQSH